MKVVEVTQFFEYKGMKWKDLVKVRDKPVLLDTTGKSCLWTESSKLIDVDEKQYPTKGDVWLKESKNGGVEIYKANYDSSD